MRKYLMLLACLYGSALIAQDYYFKNFEPFKSEIPTPEAFLGYAIGEKHTRHDQIVEYLRRLADLSDRANIEEYGQTHEGRKLVILTISSPENMARLEESKAKAPGLYRARTCTGSGGRPAGFYQPGLQCPR